MKPKKATTLIEEMECYSLPYGGLGFTSHILTYYTVAILSAGRSPIRPWRKLSNSSLDLWLSSIGLVGGFAVALFTLVRCRNHWQLLVIGIWKMSMSLFNGIVGVHIAIVIRKAARKSAIRAKASNTSSSAYLPLVDREKEADSASQMSEGEKEVAKSRAKEQAKKEPSPDTAQVWLWVFLYVPGMVAGFVGLISLIIENWAHHPKLHIITYAFSGVLFFLFSVFSIFSIWLMGDESRSGTALMSFFGALTSFATLAALYGDWALGAMADNLLGTPSGDSTGLYWSYFFLKRLTMLFA